MTLAQDIRVLLRPFRCRTSAFQIDECFILGLIIVLTAGSVCAVELGPLPPKNVALNSAPPAAVPFDIETLKNKWRSRIAAIKAQGRLPIIDIESSFGPGRFDAGSFSRTMDELGVALVMFSPQIGAGGAGNPPKLWHDGAQRLAGLDPWRYVPTSTAGIYPAWTKQPLAFLDETIAHVQADKYPLLGEFEFRHYMSPRQAKRGETFRDVDIPIDGPAGHRLFNFAQRTGLSFQIHFEVEDRLLPKLEAMLARYPKAKVVWCHIGQVRYAERARSYGSEYVRRLIDTYPNIYFDLAFGGPDSVYPLSQQHHATVWDRPHGGVKAEWVKVIEQHPWRFLAAFDLGGDRMDQLPEKVRLFRIFLAGLPPETRAIVAYKSAWKLLFGEELD
jgi:hypothetical protein